MPQRRFLRRLFELGPVSPAILGMEPTLFFPGTEILFRSNSPWMV
jgi:hypothetical protein